MRHTYTGLYLRMRFISASTGALIRFAPGLATSWWRRVWHLMPDAGRCPPLRNQGR